MNIIVNMNVIHHHENEVQITIMRDEIIPAPLHELNKNPNKNKVVVWSVYIVRTLHSVLALITIKCLCINPNLNTHHHYCLLNCIYDRSCKNVLSNTTITMICQLAVRLIDGAREWLRKCVFFINRQPYNAFMPYSGFSNSTKKRKNLMIIYYLKSVWVFSNSVFLRIDSRSLSYPI